MNEQNEKFLVETYPGLYRDYGGDMRHTCMHWGFSCGDGWFDLINDLSKKITQVEKTKGIEVVADQVKEKFGGLRFYYHMAGYKESFICNLNYKLRTFMCSRGFYKAYWKLNDFRKKIWRTGEEKISDIIHDAEDMSYKICERCGKPGKTEGGGWVSTLCNKCRNKE